MDLRALAMKVTLTGNQRRVLIAHNKRIAKAKAAYESAAKMAAALDPKSPQSKGALNKLDQAKSRWRTAVNESASYIAAEIGAIEWRNDFGGTAFGLALIQFFHFQTTSDQNLIASGSAQMSSVMESLLASRPAWASK